jgi:uncharacterized protein (TIGR04255 family)
VVDIAQSFTRVVTRSPEEPSILLIVSYATPDFGHPTANGISNLLDIDVTWSAVKVEASARSVMPFVAKLKKIANDTFESYITDKTRELLDA